MSSKSLRVFSGLIQTGSMMKPCLYFWGGGREEGRGRREGGGREEGERESRWREGRGRRENKRREREGKWGEKEGEREEGGVGGKR